METIDNRFMNRGEVTPSCGDVPEQPAFLHGMRRKKHKIRPPKHEFFPGEFLLASDVPMDVRYLRRVWREGKASQVLAARLQLLTGLPAERFVQGPDDPNAPYSNYCYVR